MPDVVLLKDGTGKLDGLGERDRRAWGKFRRLIRDMRPGETVEFSYRLARSPQHHRFFFARLQALLERQESFADLDRLLAFLKVGAGFVDFMPSPIGLVAVPKSIAWANLEEQQFAEVVRAIWDFLWTEAAQIALWPHLGEQGRYQMVKQWVMECDQ